MDAVLFDVDDTLCRYRRPGSELLALAFDRVGVESFFEVVVFAGHDTAPKPDPEPFRRALGALSVDPGRAVHVGNSLESDVAGARTAGVRAAWLDDADASAASTTPDPEPTYTLASPADLHDPPWRG